MSAFGIAEQVREAIEDQEVRLRTRQLRQCRHGWPYRKHRRGRKAVETVDTCVGKIVKRRSAKGVW